MKRPFDAGAKLADALASGETRHFHLEIGRDGSWSYQGSKIDRPALIKLFAGALRRADDGSFWLVTPSEVGEIDVEDVPFTIVEVTSDPTAEPAPLILMRTNLDQWLTLGAEHPLVMRLPAGAAEVAVPYVTVRPGLEARLTRAAFYDLVELAEPEDDDGVMTIKSGDQSFTLGRLDDA